MMSCSPRLPPAPHGCNNPSSFFQSSKILLEVLLKLSPEIFCQHHMQQVQAGKKFPVTNPKACSTQNHPSAEPVPIACRQPLCRLSALSYVENSFPPRGHNSRIV